MFKNERGDKMSKIHLEYGDLVIYSICYRPAIGKYVRKDVFGKLVIVPEDGNIVRRKPSDVVKLAAVYKKYEEKIKKQTWSL